MPSNNDIKEVGGIEALTKNVQIAETKDSKDSNEGAPSPAASASTQEASPEASPTTSPAKVDQEN